MTTLIMTSKQMVGEVIFQYNENNLLDNLIISATLTDKQYQWLLQNAPWHTDKIDEFKALAPNAQFINNPREVTFEMMWNRANDKSRSSRKKSLARWERMTISNQIKAYLYWPTYIRNKGNAEQKYLETYLNAELWNN